LDGSFKRKKGGDDRLRAKIELCVRIEKGPVINQPTNQPTFLVEKQLLTVFFSLVKTQNGRKNGSTKK
jgi:hypothetical protein